jgi:hypothetical protein
MSFSAPGLSGQHKAKREQSKKSKEYEIKDYIVLIPGPG